MCLEGTVKALARMLELHDPTSEGHSQRVAVASEFVAIQMSMTFSDISDIKMAAWLHDIGKVSIPQQLLRKDPRELSVTEKALMNEHPFIAEKMLREINGLENACEIVRHQHEKYDGTGYPEGLKGEQIPRQARIIQIADIFDALTTTRAYRDAYHWREALEILQGESGSVVDPHLCDVFVRMLMRLYHRNPDVFEVIGESVPAPNLAGNDASLAELGRLG